MKSGFDGIIDVNEHIKRVDALSSRINIEAINASLSVRAAGERGRGFAVVARELQRFSQRLHEFQREQIELNNRIIMLTAQRMGLKMRARHLHKAMASDAVGRLAGNLAEQLDGALDASEREIAAHQQMIADLVERMRRYCKVGDAIAKNGMVEAAHCGQVRNDLRSVADALERAVAEISLHLDGIGRIVTFTGVPGREVAA